MKKILWLFLLVFGFTGNAFSQIGWWTSSDTLNVFNKNKGAVLIGSYQPLGKLTVGPDDKFYNLSLVGDYNNLAKNYLQIGVTGRGFENLQGQTIFDLYHSNTQARNAGYNFRVNGNSQFFINGEGNIGIGTEKPEAKLDINGGPNWGGFTKALRIPAEHAIKFESNGSEYGMVATGGMLNFVTSNQNESTNPFGVPFSRIMSLQRNKVVIEGDIEVKGKIYSQGQVGGGGDIPVDNGGGGSGGGGKGDGGILPTIAPQGSGVQDWEASGNNIYYTYNNGNVGIGTDTPTGRFQVNTGSATAKGIVIRRSASQTANLLEFQDENGNLLSTFSSGGGFNVKSGTVANANHTNLRIQSTAANYTAYLDIYGLSGSTSVNWQLGHMYYNSGTFAIGRAVDANSNFGSGQRPNEITIYSNGAVAIGGINSAESNQLTVNGRTVTPISGTVSVAAGSNAVTGSGTSFLSQLSVGQIIKIGTQKIAISSIQSNNSLTLGSNHTAGASAVAAYKDLDNLFAIRKGDGTQVFNATASGSLGIGTTNPGTDKLAVNGTIRAKELYLTTAASAWSDFVFDQGYYLRSLTQVENYIKKNGHLPEIPSQKEVAEKGVGVIDMQSKLLQKIEELTLYLIEQNKKNEEQNKRIQVLEERLKDKK